jgi:hypothetical protein
MWGRKKPEQAQQGPAVVATQEPPDEIISRALSAYQHHFYETEKGKPDPSVADAKAKVARAASKPSLERKLSEVV